MWKYLARNNVSRSFTGDLTSIGNDFDTIIYLSEKLRLLMKLMKNVSF